MKPSLTGSPNCLDQYNSSVLGSKRKEAQNVLPLLCSSFIWPSVGLCLLLLSAAITSIPQKEIKLTGRTKLSFIACWEACFLIQSLVCSEYPPPPILSFFCYFVANPNNVCVCLYFLFATKYETPFSSIALNLLYFFYIQLNSSPPCSLPFCCALYISLLEWWQLPLHWTCIKTWRKVCALGSQPISSTTGSLYTDQNWAMSRI